ncbi:hypothetical protein REPUB_Repub07fG0013800 [Reevesia pubescens]
MNLTLIFFIIFCTSIGVCLADSDNLQDACPTNTTAKETVFINDFPGLNTLGLSIARTDLEADGIVTPHSHPRASELFFLSKGIVLAGFIDTNNTLFQSLLKGGDIILFPRGLLLFCMNAGYEPATAFSVLNSQNPGVVSIGGAMFESDSKLIDNITRRLIYIPASELKHISNTTLAK